MIQQQHVETKQMFYIVEKAQVGVMTKTMHERSLRLRFSVQVSKYDII